ncbi:MAG: DUF3794 domain-containing protein [Thermoflexaceae bacterium]|nr:DUF3794 domain-containing protein [Thermoflexaceae bacterium]
MELVKKSVRLNCSEKSMKKFKTVDEDMNVPEMKGDINKIICSTHEAVIENMKASDRKEAVRGYVEFDILYLNSDNGGLEHLEGKYPFEETFELEDEKSQVNFRGKAEIEDFSVKIINSRKINIKSLIAISCFGDEISDDEIVTDVTDGNVLVRKENMVFSQIKADGEDTFRIKEDIELPKNKPNVRNLIWSDMRLKSRETRLLDDGLYIKGDIGIFIIYTPDNDDITQWYETAVPFEGKVELSGVSEEMFSMIPLRLQETSVLIKADYDGEERVIGAEGIIKIDIKAYSEEEMPVVWDMYSTANHVDVKSCDKNFQQMIMKNSLKARGYNKYKISDADEKPLQICYAYGDAHLENAAVTEDGMKIEGFVDVTVIYISADDNGPMASFQCQVPFLQEMSMEKQAGTPEYAINLCVDQINASMISGDEVEVRVFVGIEILMMRVMSQKFITEADMTPMTSKELSSFPGIIGYIVSNEETLWDIAKRYKTTVEKIRGVNKITVDNVKRGDKLLITR